MTILRPLPGDPGTVRALADRLAGQGELLLTMASTVRGLGDPGAATWDGPAGAAFAARSHVAASLLVSVGRRYAVSAVALRPLAAALAQAQHDIWWAVATHTDALPLAVSLGNQRVTAQQSADPAQRLLVADLHRKEIEQLELVQLAERRHAAAWHRFAEADRRCATVLHRLTQDGLDDSRLYDALTGVSHSACSLGTTTGVVAMVPTPVTEAVGLAATVASGLQVAGDVVLKVGYGDGQWGGIAVEAATTAAGPASGLLKRGGLAANPAALLSPTRTGRRLLRYTTTGRLRVGTVEGLRQAGRAEAGPVPRIFHATRSPGSPTATAHWAAEQVVGRARVMAQNAWLDDLALVTGDAARSRTMFVTGLVGEATTTGVGVASTGLSLTPRGGNDRHDGR